jgi:choline dehydrogenase-like flavoprotein
MLASTVRCSLAYCAQPLSESRLERYDAIIIGSGFGGGGVAHQLVRAGWRVLMLERGDHVERGEHNWEPDGSLDLTPFYSKETPYSYAEQIDKTASRLDKLLTRRTGATTVASCYCVGGPSVFYGAVSLRLRHRDFECDPVHGDSGADWPFGYETLESYYCAAEALLDVAGEAGKDPTEPPRSCGYPQPPAPLSATSQMIAGAAVRLGLTPFRLPLAINYVAADQRNACVGCTTCDTFACAIGAKNDVATRVLQPLLGRGLELRPNTVVTRLVADGDRVAAVEATDRESGEPMRFVADHFILSAGALATPHLLLASGLDKLNPGGDVVGRYLTRHCNAIAFGLFRRPVNPAHEFHKQIGLHDYYYGDEKHAALGKLGGIQQLHSPPVGLVHQHLPPGLAHLVGAFIVPRMTGLLVLAEDEPRYDNRVMLQSGAADKFGLPAAEIRHTYTERDLLARDALLVRAREVLSEAGALWCYSHYIHTFSHAAGTVRMGGDPARSALDEYCRFRGVQNLRVVDASILPSGGGVNPSLTVAANALRVGEHLAAQF